MKKYLWIASFYLALGLIGGVVYRGLEMITSFNSPIDYMHPHVMVLGFMFSIICLLLAKNNLLITSKKNHYFLIFYHGGLIISIIGLFLKNLINFNYMLNEHMVSGISGIGHIIITIGLVLFVLNIKESIK